MTVDSVARHAERLGFHFPVAIDDNWQTLTNWWLDSGHRKWTSVSFLLDRQGRITHIHPGGQYVKGDASYTTMRRKIEEALSESQ
jgi:hypothetical protein